MARDKGKNDAIQPPAGGPGNISDLEGSGANTRIVLLAIGEIKANMETMAADVRDLKADVAKLKTTVTQARTILGAIVVFSIIFWWMFGQHVEAMFQNGLREVMAQKPIVVQQLPPPVTGAQTPP